MNDSPAGAATPAPQAQPAAPIPYPLAATIERQEEYSRFLPLVKWLLAIPHYFVITVLAIGGIFVVFASFFAVLFTGRYPRALYDYVVGVHRYGWRLGAYLFLMTDSYPKFSIKPEPGEPAPFTIAYPEQGVDRWRPLVQWLLAIPYMIVARALQYLAFACVFIAFFAILFTKRFPDGLFNLVLIPLRWNARAQAYSLWLTRRYPPFAWE